MQWSNWLAAPMDRRSLWRRATIAAGKALVTANKAMIAHHGLALAEAAEAAGVPLKFEAAVAGGIPVIKGLREGAAANAIERVHGILNGTCNFILSTMERTRPRFRRGAGRGAGSGLRRGRPDASTSRDRCRRTSWRSSPPSPSARASIFASVSAHGIAHVRAADIARAAAIWASSFA